MHILLQVLEVGVFNRERLITSHVSWNQNAFLKGLAPTSPGCSNLVTCFLDTSSVLKYNYRIGANRRPGPVFFMASAAGDYI